MAQMDKNQIKKIQKSLEEMLLDIETKYGIVIKTIGIQRENRFYPYHYYEVELSEE